MEMEVAVDRFLHRSDRNHEANAIRAQEINTQKSRWAKKGLKGDEELQRRNQGRIIINYERMASLRVKNGIKESQIDPQSI